MHHEPASKGRQRLLDALSHRESAIPFDLGSTAVSGAHVTIVEGLRRHFGLEKRPVKVHEPYQMLGLVEEDLRQALGVDTTGIFARNTMFGFPVEGWKEWQTPWGQDVLVPEGFRTTRADNGDVLIYPEGDTSVNPSGKMPTGGYFFDSIIRQEPIDEEHLDPAANLEEFTPIPEADVSYFGRAVEEAGRTTAARVANFGGTGIGDIALVPGPFMKHPRGIRDVAEWYMSTVARPDYVRAIFDRQTQVAVENLQRIHAKIGNAVDVVFLCGTDFGAQSTQFCSPATFDSLYAPYYKRMNDWIHRHTSWKTFKHSCGAILPLIPNMIEAGFDIINPVQLSAAGMDAVELKKRFGDRLVFCGGAVDTQKTLPFGTPQDVRKEVLSRCEVLGKGGGFVFNPVHNIQARTPIANVVAMVDALREHNGEPAA
ncbi:MAG TPA: uroporphyrinogen decarboxylase family protein [Spirochaetia bacterium]|nr:uroporphyrinogen decarboxylase family protein [Spirochaetia bacterium]